MQTASVNLAADQCRSTPKCEFRGALLSELRYNKSPAVRKTALDGLEAYVADDEQVRYAVLDTLMRDQSAEVRSEAIAMLKPVQADSSVRQVLRQVSTQDSNPAIRNASWTVLQGTAHIE